MVRSGAWDAFFNKHPGNQYQMLLAEEPPFEPQGIRLKYVCLFVGCTYPYEIIQVVSQSCWANFQVPTYPYFQQKLVSINFNLSIWQIENFFTVLICIFLITWGMERIFIRLLATDNHPVIVIYWKYIFSSLFGIFLKPKRPLNSNYFLLSIVLTIHRDPMRQKDRTWHMGSLPQWEGTGSSQGHSPLYPWTMREAEKALKMKLLVSKLSVLKTQTPYI